MSAPAKKEVPCPDCGEMVRPNSLRCWNCGAFMNRDVEAKFLQLQANPAPMIFSELPASEIHAYEPTDDIVTSSGAGGDDDDFQLSTATSVVSAESQSAPGSATKETAAEASRPSPIDPSPVVSHSVATGGDALLDIAMQEMAETRTKRQQRKSSTPGGEVRTPGGGMLIYCPYGCRIEVKEEHRGMQGKCPKCQAPFVVPIDPPRYKKAKTGDASKDSTSIAGKFTHWLNDLHLHVVSPEKLKLKPDSLAKEFVEADFGFSSGHLLVAILSKKGGGMFGGGDKKADGRAAIYQHLKVDGPLADTPAGEKYIFSADDVKKMKVVQPAASPADNIFHGIAVFGTGKVAVQLPLNEKSKEPLFVSMGITEYWEFCKVLDEKFGMKDFGVESKVPREPVFKDYFCHYTATKIKALDNVDLYKADPKAQLVTAGYRCGKCALVVSEAGRAKQNLGGKDGKAIAKALCPKCKNKMGSHPLFSLKTQVEEPSLSGAPASGEKST